MTLPPLPTPTTVPKAARRLLDRNTSAYASLIFNCEFQAGVLIRDIRRDETYREDEFNASRECHGLVRDLGSFGSEGFRPQAVEARAAALLLARSVDALVAHTRPGLPRQIRQTLEDGYRYGRRALRELNDVRRANALAPIP